MKRKGVTTKDNFQARLAFYLSLGVIIPLFNMGFSATAVIIALRSLSMMRKDPRIGGFNYAVAALVIGLAGVIGSIIGIAIFLMKRVTCDAIPAVL
ncbi:MAG: hypothetical protein KC535_05655 [Nanoarchaeota archaeon]|nr:hypothetical protein [Nanoarchaeota archaeon]